MINTGGGNISIEIIDKNNKESTDDKNNKKDNENTLPNIITNKNTEPIKKTSDSIRKSNRCAQCNKKLQLTAVKCKCDNLYCSEHIFSKDHGCSFDYKKVGKELLTQQHPTIVCKKIDKL